MLSKITNDIKFENGIAKLVPKEYPNWYGIEDIGFIWHGEWADPEIEHDGMIVDLVDIENTMLDRWISEENGDEDDDAGFAQYMQKEADEVRYLIGNAYGLPI